MTARLAPDYGAPSSGTGVVTVVLLHAAVFAALSQFEAVRSSVSDAAPLFVSFFTPEQPKVEAPPPPKIVPKKEPPRLVTVDRPATSADTFIGPPPPPEPEVVAPATEAPAPPPALLAAAPAPKVVTSVEYIRPPQVEYPALSRRLGEQGRVLVRVLINRDGRAERVEVQSSSGSRRLDEAAIKAAREALYRPYSENGQPIPVWALVPTLFELS